MTKATQDPVLYTVHTTVTPSTVEGGDPYEFVLDLDPVIVTRRNAIIAYQLTDDTPANITFTGMEPIDDDKLQLSTCAISRDGRTLTFGDANSEPVRGTISIKLKFGNGYGNGKEGEFDHDPQIENVPES